MTLHPQFTVREVKERHTRAVKRARNGEIREILQIIDIKTRTYYNKYSCGVIPQQTIDDIKRQIRYRIQKS